MRVKSVSFLDISSSAKYTKESLTKISGLTFTLKKMLALEMALTG